MSVSIIFMPVKVLEQMTDIPSNTGLLILCEPGVWKLSLTPVDPLSSPIGGNVCDYMYNESANMFKYQVDTGFASSETELLVPVSGLQCGVLLPCICHLLWTVDM